MKPGAFFKMRPVVFAILFLLNHAVFGQNKNLDYYLSTGLANSPLLKDYQNQLSLNSVDSQRLRANFHPQVNGSSANMAAPVINGWGYDPILTNFGSYTTMVNVSQTFIGHQNLNAQYNAIRLLSDSVRYMKKISEQDLKRSITAQYIAAYGDFEQLNFNITVNNILLNQEVILKKLTQNNIYRQTDYLTFLVTLKQQELQVKQLRIQLRLDFATLNYLCGIFDTAVAYLDTPGIVLQYPADVASSVFFQRYIRDSINLENSIRILNYSYRPKLSAFANAGYSSSLQYQAEKNFGFSVGMNLAVPIYDGHLKKLQTQKLKIIENTGTNYKDFFARQFGQQIAMLRQQLVATESLINDIDEQVKYADALINVNKKLLETGDSKIADYVIAINSYLNARNLLTQNNISRMQIINQINYWNR
jgi:outer membrane protein TolC